MLQVNNKGRNQQKSLRRAALAARPEGKELFLFFKLDGLAVWATFGFSILHKSEKEEIGE